MLSRCVPAGVLPRDLERRVRHVRSDHLGPRAQTRERHGDAAAPGADVEYSSRLALGDTCQRQLDQQLRLGPRNQHIRRDRGSRARRTHAHRGCTRQARRPGGARCTGRKQDCAALRQPTPGARPGAPCLSPEHEPGAAQLRRGRRGSTARAHRRVAWHRRSARQGHSPRPPRSAAPATTSLATNEPRRSRLARHAEGSLPCVGRTRGRVWGGDLSAARPHPCLPPQAGEGARAAGFIGRQEKNHPDRHFAAGPGSGYAGEVALWTGCYAADSSASAASCSV